MTIYSVSNAKVHWDNLDAVAVSGTMTLHSTRIEPKYLITICPYCDKQFDISVGIYGTPEFIYEVENNRYVACCSSECVEKLKQDKERIATLVL